MDRRRNLAVEPVITVEHRARFRTTNLNGELPLMAAPHSVVLQELSVTSFAAKQPVTSFVEASSNFRKLSSVLTMTIGEHPAIELQDYTQSTRSTTSREVEFDYCNIFSSAYNRQDNKRGDFCS
jgi:hypothetical protein